MEKIVNRLLLATLVLAAVFGALAYHFRDAEHDSAAGGEYTLPMCEYIDIDLTGLPVTVIPCDESRIRVVYENDLPLSLDMGDNRLTITESDRFVVSLFTGGGERFGLYLYLPREIYREISIYTGSGDVKVGGVECQRLTAITDSGNITCEQTVSMINLSTTGGFISVDFDRIASGSEILSQNGGAEFIIPKGSSLAVDFDTETGYCETELWNGFIPGSYMYSFNGGDKLIHATLGKGVLTIKEKKE